MTRAYCAQRTEACSQGPDAPLRSTSSCSRRSSSSPPRAAAQASRTARATCHEYPAASQPANSTARYWYSSSITGSSLILYGGKTHTVFPVGFLRACAAQACLAGAYFHRPRSCRPDHAQPGRAVPAAPPSSARTLRRPACLPPARSLVEPACASAQEGGGRRGHTRTGGAARRLDAGWFDNRRAHRESCACSYR